LFHTPGVIQILLAAFAAGEHVDISITPPDKVLEIIQSAYRQEI
jgi:hypothetical protein